MKTVTDLLQTKGHTVWSVAPETSVYEALELMAAKDVGALLVLDAGQVVGIFSERDYARKVILKGKASRDTPVRDIMTARVVYVRPEQVVEVAFDGVQTSRRYPGGVALRFARVKGYRPDKRAEEADTIDTVRAIHAP